MRERAQQNDEAKHRPVNIDCDYIELYKVTDTSRSTTNTPTNQKGISRRLVFSRHGRFDRTLDISKKLRANPLRRGRFAHIGYCPLSELDSIVLVSLII
jgi:hypothetical protein